MNIENYTFTYDDKEVSIILEEQYILDFNFKFSNLKLIEEDNKFMVVIENNINKNILKFIDFDEFAFKVVQKSKELNLIISNENGKLIKGYSFLYNT